MDSKNLKVFVVFVVVYALLYFLGIMFPQLQDWNFTADFSRLDYTLFFLPIAGFFFVYLLIPVLEKDFGFGKFFLYAFPLLYLLGSYFAFIVAVYYYYGNQAFLSGVDISVFNLDYLKLFLESSFIYFVLAGIGGWAAHVLIENFEEISEQKE